MHSLLRVAVVVALAIAGVVGQQARAAGLEPEKQVFIDQGMAWLFFPTSTAAASC
jgi:hypothetical protein